MKLFPQNRLFLSSFLFAFPIAATAALVPLPDGGFEGGRGGWVENFGGAGVVYEYPATGGNPGGHGIIDDTAGGQYAIWISSFNEPILLADLGLEAGQTYTFLQDMKRLSGLNLGGLKVDFFNQGAPNGSSGDLRKPAVGDGSAWATYSFDVTIPLGTDGIKLVPLWGPGSRVAYDNFFVNDEPVPVEGGIPDADFEGVGGQEWEQTSGFGTFSFEFPDSGGNPGGYGVIDNSAGDGGFGVLVTDNGQALPLSGLGMEAGKAYRFLLDMRLFSGTEIGGFKVDFFDGGAANGTTGDLFPALIGDGTTWETYEFQVAIPANTTGVKLVALWGAGSRVGYDNFAFSSEPIEVDPLTAIPNGDFAQGDNEWIEAGGENTTFGYESSGGNPDQYGVMDNNGAGFGVWVANGGAPIPLADLGLEAGLTYRFQQDMRLFSGDAIGGLKVEFVKGGTPRGDTGDLRRALIGDGSSWETYDFVVSIPMDVDGFKLVPLWGPGSRVGYDNFRVDPVAVPSPPVLETGFEEAGANWAEFASGTTFQYLATGGNPDGYVTMTNNGEVDSWGVVVSNNSNVIPKSRFGITAEGSYEFKVDMKIFEGSGIGGLKVEFFDDGVDSGSSGDLFPSVIGDGSTWETYVFDVFIPDFVDGLKVTLLWGPGSTVGYDNVVVPGDLGEGFDRWIRGFPGVGDRTGFLDDADGDGQSNGLENFLGSDPASPSRGLTVVAPPAGARPGDFYFVHSVNPVPVPEASRGRYLWSTDLVNFFESGAVAPDGTSMEFRLNPPGLVTIGETRAVLARSVGARVPSRVFVQLAVSGSE